MGLWACAKLAYHPGRLLADYGRRIQQLADTFTPSHCTNTLWALSVLQVRIGRPNTAALVWLWPATPRLRTPPVAGLWRTGCMALSVHPWTAHAGTYPGCHFTHCVLRGRGDG